MKKITILMLALVMALPVVVGAENNNANLRKIDDDDFEVGTRTATATLRKIDDGGLFYREGWKKTMTDFRDKIKLERQYLKASTSEMKGKENKEERKDLKQETRGRIDQLRSQRVGIFADNMLQRISQQIKNLTNLLTRTSNRAKEMAEDGKDVTAINAKIVIAQTALDATKAEFALLPAKFDLLLTSTDTQLIADTKNAASSTIAKIRTTHAKIVEAITLIKSAN